MRTFNLQNPYAMAKLFQAQYPASRPRREVWLLVLLVHLLALWLINLYWPVQRVITQVVVQIFRANATHTSDSKAADARASTPSPALPVQNTPLNEPSKNITQRQRGITAQSRLRATPQLSLPTLIAEQSTPLQNTSQLPALKPSRKRSRVAAAPVGLFGEQR